MTVVSSGGGPVGRVLDAEVLEDDRDAALKARSTVWATPIAAVETEPGLAGSEEVIRFGYRPPVVAARIGVHHTDDTWRRHTRPARQYTTDSPALMQEIAVSAGCH